MTTRICPKALGAILKARREALGMTIDEVADRVILRPMQVIDVELGPSPRFEVTLLFGHFCRVLSCDPANVIALATIPGGKE